MASNGPRKPKMVVFDLDYTLWPFWVDTHVDPPFQKRKSGEIVDRHGRMVKPFRDVPKVLAKLKQDGYIIAVASRFKKNSGIDFEDMLFFDDEYRNIRDLSKVGVTCYYIDENIGVTEGVIEEGFKQFADGIKAKSR